MRQGFLTVANPSFNNAHPEAEAANGTTERVVEQEKKRECPMT